MMIDVILPKLSLAMEEGTVVRWLKRVGDPVKEGEILFEVESDKSVLEVEAAADGVLSEILVDEGQTAPVAAPVARIRTAGSDLDEVQPVGSGPSSSTTAGRTEAQVKRTEAAVGEATSSGWSSSATAGPTEAAAGEATSSGWSSSCTAGPSAPSSTAAGRTEAAAGQTEAAETRRQFISWRARRLAREHGLDISQLPPGSGPQGRVIERDVTAVISASGWPSSTTAGPTEAGGEWLVPTPVQRITAERMAHSFSSAPHFYLTVEVIAENLLALRERKLQEVEADQGIRLTVTDLLVKLAALALRDHPRANASWVDGRIRLSREIHVGLATSAPQGLLVPVIRHADRRSLEEIASERAALVAKAQANKLHPDEMSGASFTLTNLGMFGIDQFQAIINPPQSVILAVGRIKDRPVGVNGQVVLKPVFYLSLSCDHRVLDGVTGAAFLQRVVELIENPVL